MKNVTLYKVLTPLLAMLLLVGCSDDKSEISEDVTYKNFQITADQSQLSALQIEIAAKVNAGEPIAFTKITEALVEEHGNRYNIRQQQRNRGSLSTEQGNDSISTLSAVLNLDDEKKINIDGDFNAIKVEAENALREKHNAELIYNVASTSPLDLVNENRMQCYSGTIYNTLVFRSGLRKQYVNKNPVVIYSEGHILPGYIANGNLVGVETTAAGRAEMNYGAVAKLNSPLRIIDAEMFALMDIFKTQQDMSAFVQEALKQTAEKYNIPLDRLENLVAQKLFASSGGGVSTNELILNADPMAFGKANVGAGDKQRDIIERQTKEQALLPEDAVYSDGEPVYFEGPVVMVPELENLSGLKLNKMVIRGLRSYVESPRQVRERDMMIIEGEGVSNIWNQIYSRIYDPYQEVALDFNPNRACDVDRYNLNADNRCAIAVNFLTELSYKEGRREFLSEDYPNVRMPLSSGDMSCLSHQDEFYSRLESQDNPWEMAAKELNQLHQRDLNLECKTKRERLVITGRPQVAGVSETTIRFALGVMNLNGEQVYYFEYTTH